MPLILDKPEVVTVNAVRVVSFRVQSEPLSIEVNYQRGVDKNGAFAATDAATALFDTAAIEQVDPQGKLYDGIKDAIYTLLESVVGQGTIE
jgi:hypothetical protein